MLTKLLLAAFGIIIVCVVDLWLPTFIYLIAVFLYVLLSFIFIKRKRFRKYSHILDLLLVLLLLFKSPLDSLAFFSLLLFPLICRGVYIDRYTNDRYYMLEYLVLVLIVVLSYGMQDFKFYVYQVLGITLFVFLYIMHVQRMRHDERINQMLDIADDYFIEQNKSFEVYKKILNYLKEHNKEVISITCLECDSQMNNLHLVNSSFLISTFQLKLQSKDITYLIRGLNANNVDFIVDGKKQNVNVVYPVAQASGASFNWFLFILVYNPIVLHTKDLNLEPLFLRMARLISFERTMRKKRDVTIQDMIQKSRFVNGATNTMHFLKNRLTPLQTLVDLAKDEGGVKQLENYDELLRETANSAQKEIDVILKKAEYLLNKKNNPFVFTKFNCDTQSIFITLSSIWTNLLPETAKMDVIMGADGGIVYESNIEGLEILFSDIVGNMNKYSKNNQYCIFRQDEQSNLSIIFENDFGNKKEIQALISDINNPHKGAVIYRTSYGVTNIRTIAENLSIDLKANLVSSMGGELYQLVLTIKSKTNEKIIDN